MRRKFTVAWIVASMVVLIGVVLLLNKQPKKATILPTATQTTTSTTVTTTTTSTTVTTTTTSTTVTSERDMEDLMDDVIFYRQKTVTVDAVAVRDNNGEICDYLSKGSSFWTDATQYKEMLHIYYWSDGVRDGWLPINHGWWE